jgi:hypothetical protein
MDLFFVLGVHQATMKVLELFRILHINVLRLLIFVRNTINITQHMMLCCGQANGRSGWRDPRPAPVGIHMGDCEHSVSFFLYPTQIEAL